MVRTQRLVVLALTALAPVLADARVREVGGRDVARVRVFSRLQVASAEVSPGPGARVRVNGDAVSRPVRLSIAGGRVRAAQNGFISECDEVHIETEAGPFQITPRGHPPRQYEGRVLVRARRGQLLFVNEVPLEAYVAAVMAPESADLVEPEALKAMAVVIRSYTTAEQPRHRADGADFCDLTHCQVYKGCMKLSDSWRIIAESTHGEALRWKGRPVIAYYHACCGGRTESGRNAWKITGPSYLASVSDETAQKGKSYCQKNPQYRWTSRIPPGELGKAAVRAGWIRPGQEISTVTVTRRTETGRARTVTLGVGAKAVAVSGSEFVRRVGQALGWNRLKSNWFDVEAKGSSFHFRGRGFGHGVGFCQSGADGMARAGMSHGRILRHYFPGVEIAGAE